MRLLVCVSWVPQSRLNLRRPKRRTNLAQAQLPVNGLRRSSAITATMASKPVQPTAPTSRLPSRPLGTQVSHWHIRTLKAPTVLSSCQPRTPSRTCRLLRSTAVYKPQAPNGVSHHTLAQMEASLGIQAHSRMTCRRTSTKPCLFRIRKSRTHNNGQRIACIPKDIRNSLME
jgi:hypothetical protein